MNHELIIQTKTLDMMKYGYIALRQFPKSEKHVMAAEIRQSMLKILRLIITASKRYHKKTTLQDLDIEIAMLRNAVLLSFQLKYIDIKKYEHWQRQINEIGNMLGGWLKNQK
ncbi:hypothetical protein EQ875_01663 [Photobacterium damselae subsp. damselae]|uniref:diversity-generating retroelement protein Avd n=1 Tax=Photobacterium damselae TaxID=38293 RepID=UPI00109BF2BE|nr:diversity-generating retroelement protein Avd [Photobacterium damselae]TGZ35382.1 hypothetical protein EQ875_01663 [Photobacterium damselae subsp. damselae]